MVTVGFPFNVICGAVVSTILTVRVTSLAALLEESDTLYVMVYVPTALSFTGFTVVMLAVKLPSKLSRALAPWSTYNEETS